jgi:L-lactate utilization protein LutB
LYQIFNKKKICMTPQEERNERLAKTMIKNLQRRHIEGYYCPTAEEAVKKVSELIADGSSVTWGGTMTVRDLGIPEVLKSRGTLQVLDRDLVTTAEEKQDMYLRAFSADVYLSSANAISEDGVIVNIDGNGNRVAAITWGPKKVIFVIGMNKVAQTVEAALARARSTASPINAARFDIKTPCQTDGTCHNCNSTDSICNYIHFLRNSPKGRHVVVLVGENLGY